MAQVNSDRVTPWVAWVDLALAVVSVGQLVLPDRFDALRRLAGLAFGGVLSLVGIVAILGVRDSRWMGWWTLGLGGAYVFFSFVAAMPFTLRDQALRERDPSATA